MACIEDALSKAIMVLKVSLKYNDVRMHVIKGSASKDWPTELEMDKLFCLEIACIIIIIYPGKYTTEFKNRESTVIFKDQQRTIKTVNNQIKQWFANAIPHLTAVSKSNLEIILFSIEQKSIQS